MENEYLFPANFLAWRYGAVDREVYEWFRNFSSYDDYKALCLNKAALNKRDDISEEEYDMAKEFIDNLLVRIFKTADFALVDYVHNDKCWQSARNQDDSPTDNQMDNEAIIKEYADRK